MSVYRTLRSAVSTRLKRRLGLSLADKHPRLIVLLYHQVEPSPPTWLVNLGVATDAQTFEAHMRYCAGRFDFVRLSDGIARLRAGLLKRTAIAVTIDDGLNGVVRYAAPVLERFGAPGTMFVNRDFLQGGCHWYFQAAWLEQAGHGCALEDAVEMPQDGPVFRRLRHDVRLLTPERCKRIDSLYRSVANGAVRLHLQEDEVKSLPSATWEIGNHSCSHPRFVCLPADQHRQQIEANAEYLSRFDNRTALFAVPFGHPTDWNRHTVEASLACEHEFVTAHGGVNAIGQTGTDIRRIPCDGVAADRFEDHLVRHILGW